MLPKIWFILTYGYDKKLTQCMMGNFPCLLLSAEFFSKSSFLKIISGIPSVSNRLNPYEGPHFVRGLIWIETVCKGYQQTTLTVDYDIRIFRINTAMQFTFYKGISDIFQEGWPNFTRCKG